jgi:hypothetical protein
MEDTISGFWGFKEWSAGTIYFFLFCSGLTSGLLKCYIQILIPGSCECDLICKKCLCRCNYMKMRSLWINWVGSKSNNKDLHRNRRQRQKRDTEGAILWRRRLRWEWGSYKPRCPRIAWGYGVWERPGGIASESLQREYSCANTLV